nr:GNAT family N-acetyltransferase [Acidimicrobiales bacterium]
RPDPRPPGTPGTPGMVVGGTGLHRRVGPGGLEVGYWVHAHHTRQGYATEIAHAVTEAAFTDPDIDRVEIHHDRANEASAAVPRALGFRYVDYRKSEPVAPGETGAVCTWRTTRPEWFAHHP